MSVSTILLRAAVLTATAALGCAPPASAQTARARVHNPDNPRESVPMFDGYVGDPLFAADVDLQTLNGDQRWLYFSNPVYCYAVTTHDDARLLIGYDARHDTVHFAVWNTKPTSYKTADTTYLTIGFVHVATNDGRGMRDLKFIVINDDEGTSYNTKLAGREALDSLASFDAVEVVDADGNLLERFDLTGSAKATARLRTCRPNSSGSNR